MIKDVTILDNWQLDGAIDLCNEMLEKHKDPITEEYWGGLLRRLVKEKERRQVLH